MPGLHQTIALFIFGIANIMIADVFDSARARRHVAAGLRPETRHTPIYQRNSASSAWQESEFDGGLLCLPTTASACERTSLRRLRIHRPHNPNLHWVRV